MKTKFRYVLVRTTMQLGEIGEHEFYRALMHSIGTDQYFIANPRIVKNIDEHSFIMKVSLRGYSALIVALALMKHIGGSDCGFFTIHASGTLKALGGHISTSGTRSTISKDSSSIDEFADKGKI